MTLQQDRLVVRDATAADLPGLAACRYADCPAIHRDRLRDASLGNSRLFVAEQTGNMAGFGVLVFRRAAGTPGAGTTDRLPCVLDVYVAPERRGRGIGTAVLRHMERITARDGHARLFLSVDPRENSRALALYKRLGYCPLQAEPYPDVWRFTDSDGHVHQGRGGAVDMAKEL